MEPLVTILAPFAHMPAKNFGRLMGHNTSVCDAPWPKYDESHLVESTFEYPVSFNGKTRFKLELPLDYTPAAKRELKKQPLKMKIHKSGPKVNSMPLKRLLLYPVKITAL
jgi:leucyl-tRNA synthetase